MKDIKRQVIRELVELVPKVEAVVTEDDARKNVALLNKLNAQIQAGDVKANAELAIMLLFTSKIEASRG